MEETNGTLMGGFILKGFPGNPAHHVILFIVLLLILLVSLSGNTFIIAIINANCCLHSPMYFFLVCLSSLEVIMILSVVPELLAILTTKKALISRLGCFLQLYVYYFVCTSDFLVLTAMSFDRYLAVCHPLRYSSIMMKSLCIKLVGGTLLTSLVCLLYPMVTLSKMPFCGNVVDHFMCEGAAILKLLCANSSVLKLSTIMTSTFILIGCLLVTSVSYIFIVWTVIRIPTDSGRQKTVSTCVSHLTMLSLVFGSAIFIEIRPPRVYPVEVDKVVTLVSTVLAPLLNPFIYTLRNEVVKNCIKETLRQQKLLLFHR